LSSYAEELAGKLSDGKTKEQARKARDQARRRFQQLGLSKEQADTLIPIRAPGRHVEERDPIKIIAQDIIKNNLSPEEINGISYDLASFAPTTVAGSSRLNLLRKELRSLGADYLITEATKIPFITEEANQIQARKRILRGINGYDCPEFFYLEKVQKRLNECDINKPPSMQNLIDVMIMLCHASSVEHYGVMNYRPNTPAPKQENKQWLLPIISTVKSLSSLDDSESDPDEDEGEVSDVNVVDLANNIHLLQFQNSNPGFDWFTGRKYDEELQTYRAEIITDPKNGWKRASLLRNNQSGSSDSRLQQNKSKKNKVKYSIIESESDINSDTSASSTSSSSSGSEDTHVYKSVRCRKRKDWCHILDNIKKDLKNVELLESGFDEERRKKAQEIIDHWKRKLGTLSSSGTPSPQL
ncbi:6885_t:CDS:2, partial [Acaulospora colombiana]